ncbi:hypothetical protein JXB31_05565 [Candidatus Woesearchaeota archaeon]|nr:hypothetical protein [Candidatus Woesearchaeota archaeon]
MPFAVLDGTEKRILELERMISTLDWDVSIITNNELKAVKQARLQVLRDELKALKKCR